MLTLQMLKDMEPETIIAQGIDSIIHPWFNDAKSVEEGGTLNKDGKSTNVKWIAVRGGYHDWAIYHSLDANFIHADFLDDPAHLDVSYYRILKSGAKLRWEEEIRRLVPCDDEAFKMYRQ